MNNKKTGNDFEAEFAKMLSRHGFWVYNTINKAGGQPADIIACISSRPYLIDCKVCQKDVFHLSRIEENQYHAMMTFAERNDKEGCYFALQFSDGSIYMCPSLPLFLALVNNIKSLSKKEIAGCGYGIPLEEWLGDQI